MYLLTKQVRLLLNKRTHSTSSPCHHYPSPFHLLSATAGGGGGGCVVSETFCLLLGVVVLGPVFVSASFPFGP